ncbi:hypothetical protein CGMCC3_g7493 [Colletotrichum fructicola]|nr:uncharacterized protein CGMCC3_g7493 [Colletotrichum fructicola]KAE9576391.1 hypothetical protein CGMCC3_g7493 [Colletotrichum fructicola]
MFLLQLGDSFTVIHRRLDEVTITTITTTTTTNAPIQKDYRCRRRCSNYNLVMPSDKPHGIDGMHDHHLLRIAYLKAKRDAELPLRHPGLSLPTRVASVGHPLRESERRDGNTPQTRSNGVG